MDNNTPSNGEILLNSTSIVKVLPLIQGLKRTFFVFFKEKRIYTDLIYPKKLSDFWESIADKLWRPSIDSETENFKKIIIISLSGTTVGTTAS